MNRFVGGWRLLAAATMGAAAFLGASPALAASPKPAVTSTATPTTSTWAPQTSTTEEHLHGVFAYDPCHVWALGEESGGESPSVVGHSAMVATTDGGASWHAQDLGTGGINTTMNRVLFTSVTAGYAVGEENGQIQQSTQARPAGRPHIASTGARKPNFLGTSNGGVTWNDLSANLPDSTAISDTVTTSDIEGLSAVGDSVWVTVALAGQAAQGMILYSPDRGNTWTTEKTHTSTFDSIYMFDANNGFATSNDKGLWRTVNGSGPNAFWLQVPTSLAAEPEQVWATDANTAVIVEAGQIEYTSVLGTQINPATINAPGIDGSDLTDVAFSDATHGIATGELGGNHLETTDGGQTWNVYTTGDDVAKNNYNGATIARGTDYAWVVGESGFIGASKPAKGAAACAPVSSQAPATVTTTKPPGLPPAGTLGSGVLGQDLGIGASLVILIGLGLAGREGFRRANRAR